MNLYLVQHGKPLPEEIDPERPLSDEGRLDVERLGDFLQRGGFHAARIFHSGKTRARQTAEILNSKFNPEGGMEEREGLAPKADASVIAEEIGKLREDTMIVGHLPHLAKLCSILVTGRASNAVVTFQQGGVVCLRGDPVSKGWTIAWMVVPEILFP